MWRPGPQLLRAVVLLALVASAASVLPWLAHAILAAVGLLFVLSMAEALRLRRVRLSVAGWGDRVLSIGQPEELRLDIRSGAGAPLRVRLRQVWPSLLAERSAVQELRLGPGDSASVSFTVHGRRRGRETIEPPSLAATFWGLVERCAPAGSAARLSVFPDLRGVKKLHAVLNQFALRGLGNRMSARLGKGREFDRLREWVQGDEFRDISWKASARHGKLIAREFRIDRSQDVLIALDLGHRMAARVGSLTRLDHAVNAAATLAYVCNRIEDRTAVLSFSADAVAGPGPGRGAAHLARATAFAASRHAELRHTDYPGLALAVRRVARRRALVVLFTVLPGDDAHELIRAVRMMSPPHLVLVVSLVDPDLAAAARFRPSDKPELCRTLVAQDAIVGRERTVHELRKMGVLVVETLPGDAGVHSINAYIDVKRRQLL
jgi:uncharacterized protein (DUF58 family)